MKNVRPLLIIVLILLAAIVIFTLMQNSKLKQENDKVKDYFSQTLEALNEIQDSLSEIDTQDLIVKRMARNQEVDGQVMDSKERIMSSIQSINDYVALNKERLNNLEQNLQERNIKIDGLQRMIDTLKKNIAEKEAIIVQMNERIDDLELLVAKERIKYENELAENYEKINLQKNLIETQDATISEHEATIKKQTEEVNTVYYVVGKKKELIENGFMTKGGFFKKAKKSGDYNTEAMIALNLLKENSIQLNAKLKNTKVLSDQSIHSYILEENSNETVLKITDINEFRKVKYLIIQVD